MTGQREAEVLGQVPSGGSPLYCISMFAGAATYRVTVVGVQWTGGSDGPSPPRRAGAVAANR